MGSKVKRISKILMQEYTDKNYNMYYSNYV